MFMGGSGVPPATFVGMTFADGGSGSVVLNLSSIPGIQVGDYVFVFSQGGSVTAGYTSITGGGWSQDNYTWPSYNYACSVSHKKLTDLSSVTLSGMAVKTVMVVAYRGASRATRKSITESATSSLTIPGFVRTTDCVGVVSPMFDRDNVSLPNFTVPSPWVRRSILTLGFFRMSIADALKRSDYVDGASLTWTNLGSDFVRTAMMYELRI